MQTVIEILAMTQQELRAFKRAIKILMAANMTQAHAIEVLLVARRARLAERIRRAS
jgi:hypothetical protein